MLSGTFDKIDKIVGDPSPYTYNSDPITPLKLPSTKPYKFGFMIGRFQHIHKGHQHVIDQAIKLCDNLLILIGSSQLQFTERNPFSTSTRIELIKKIYPNVNVGFVPDLTHEDDISYEWGRYLLDQVTMWAKVFNIQHELDCMIYGNDEGRNDWFDPEDVANVTSVIVSRSKIKISATTMRKFLVDGRDNQWRNFADPKIHSYYKDLQKIVNATVFRPISVSARGGEVTNVKIGNEQKVKDGIECQQ